MFSKNWEPFQGNHLLEKEIAYEHFVLWYQKYDEEFFDAILPEYPELSIHYLEANLSPETAALAAGYEAICAFVNANIGAKTVEQLHRQGV